jgi:Bacterial regulatory helix-turn-helix protein, lysR family
VLAEELHFARATERLFLSPSRVSKLVSSLEHEVGGPLFERTTRRVTITPLGAALVEQMGPGTPNCARPSWRPGAVSEERSARCPSASPSTPEARRWAACSAAWRARIPTAAPSSERSRRWTRTPRFDVARSMSW